MRSLSSVFQRYSTSLKTSPYSTKMATTSFIYFAGDFICQKFIEKKTLENYHYERTFKQTLVGTFFVAPILHNWHSRIIPLITKPLTSRFKVIAVSYMLGEGVLSPFFLASILFLYEYIKTYDAGAGKRNVKEKFLPTLVRAYQFWGGISLFTYSIVPLCFRPVFTSCWSLLWNIYVSKVANSNSGSAPQENIHMIERSQDHSSVLDIIEDMTKLPSHKFMNNSLFSY